MIRIIEKGISGLILTFSLGIVSGCSGSPGYANLEGIGSGNSLSDPSFSGGSSGSGDGSGPTQANPKGIGESCSGNSSNSACLAMKYVVYKNSSGVPVVSEADAVNNLKTINKLYKQCGIQFQIDQYLAVNPSEYRLVYNTANNGELDDIRKTFEDGSTLLVVTTGSWNRSGSLGNTGANAWTSMPGESFMGVVLEKSVGTFSNIIAHELGHYVNLDHVNDESNVMNPVIYSQSTEFYSSQCNEMKDAAQKYWSKMMR